MSTIVSFSFIFLLLFYFCICANKRIIINQLSLLPNVTVTINWFRTDKSYSFCNAKTKRLATANRSRVSIRCRLCKIFLTCSSITVWSSVVVSHIQCVLM